MRKDRHQHGDLVRLQVFQPAARELREPRAWWREVEKKNASGLSVAEAIAPKLATATASSAIARTSERGPSFKDRSAGRARSSNSKSRVGSGRELFHLENGALRPCRWEVDCAPAPRLRTLNTARRTLMGSISTKGHWPSCEARSLNKL
jgi:hypothetical protein